MGNAVLPAQVIDELNLQTGEVIGCGADSTDFYAQSFFTDVWKVSRFGVWLRREQPNAFVRIALAPDRGGVPAIDSLLYESGYINPNDLGQLYVISGLNEFVEINRKYWVVVDGYLNPATTGYAAIGTSSTFTDSFDPLMSSDDGGATWQSLPGTPMAIFVEGDTCTFPVSLFSGPTSVCTESTPVTLGASGTYAHYDWSTGDTTPSIQVSSSGLYYCTVVDSAGCVGQDTVSLIVWPVPDPGLQDTVRACEGVDALIIAGPDFVDYLWSNGNPTDFQAVSVGGQYSVTVTDTNGCVGSDTTEVVFQSIPPIILGNDTSFCQGGIVEIIAPAGYVSYLWSTGDVGESILVETSASIWVEVTTDWGCTFTSDTMEFIVRPLPPTPLITPIDSMLSTPLVSGYTYSWTMDGFPSAGADSNTFVPPVHGTVTVVVTDEYGCTSESALYLYAWEPDTTGSRWNFIPSGFSPNGDGVNEVFYFPSASAEDGVKLTIVNRWGEKVYEADPYLNDWSGLGRGGEQLPSGNYFYSVEYHNGDATRQGVVLINR